MKFVCAKWCLVLVFVCGSFVFAQAQQKQTQKTVLAQGNFASLKGSLPWPTDNISELLTYKQQLAMIKNQYGINGSPLKTLTIRCDNATTVKSIAEGSVQSILDIENTKSVIVQQGDYLLVYSNLDTVYLKKGDSVSTMQPIGKLTNRTVNNYYELEMLLYRNRKQLDPYDWFIPMDRSKQMI